MQDAITYNGLSTCLSTPVNIYRFENWLRLDTFVVLLTITIT